jgi:hypothetical protein
MHRAAGPALRRWPPAGAPAAHRSALWPPFGPCGAAAASERGPATEAGLYDRLPGCCPPALSSKGQRPQQAPAVHYAWARRFRAPYAPTEAIPSHISTELSSGTSAVAAEGPPGTGAA